MASASVGRPMGIISSILLMIQLSINSIFAGMTPFSSTRKTLSPAAAASSYTAMIVFCAWGSGISFSSAFVTTPRVPSELMNICMRS
jgi:hypothetical protein